MIPRRCSVPLTLQETSSLRCKNLYSSLRFRPSHQTSWQLSLEAVSLCCSKLVSAMSCYLRQGLGSDLHFRQWKLPKFEAGRKVEVLNCSFSSPLAAKNCFKSQTTIVMMDEALNKGKNLKVCTFVITISVGVDSSIKYSG